MPFDGIETIETHPLAKLGAVEVLLATEQQWCKGRLRDGHGRHCLVGAIEAVNGRQLLQRVILHATREVSGKHYWRIEFFNDDPRTTHADVLAVLRRAREDIIAGMICEPQPWHRKWLRAVSSLWMPEPHDKTVPGSEPADFPTVAAPSSYYCSFEDEAFAERNRNGSRSVAVELQN